MAEQKNSNIARCPECDGPVQLSGKLQVGKKLPCRRCGSILVIFERKPLELILANGSHSDMDRPKVNNKKGKDAASSSNEQIDENEEMPQKAPMSRSSLADCPECSATLRFHKSLRDGQLVVCPECNETLKVVSLSPLEFNWADEDPWQYEEYDNSRYRSRNRLN